MTSIHKNSELLQPSIFRDQDKYYVGYLNPNQTGGMQLFCQATEAFWSLKEAVDELQWITL